MAVPVMALAGLAMGAIQTGISAAKASKLGSDKKYTVSPEMQNAYNMARRRADEGYSAEEKANFEQMLARQGTAAKRMFQNAGLAGAGTAASNIMGIDALNQFAANGASIRRQNAGDLYSMAGKMQGVQDAETQRYNNQLNMERQALGGATQAGIGNMMGAVGNAQKFMGQQQAMEMYKNYGMGDQGGDMQFKSPADNFAGNAGQGFSQGGYDFGFGGGQPSTGQEAGPWAMNTLQSQGTPFLSATDPNYGVPTQQPQAPFTGFNPYEFPNGGVNGFVPNYGMFNPSINN